MRILLITISAFLVSNLFSQNHFCYTTEMQNNWFSKHPELKLANSVDKFPLNLYALPLAFAPTN